MTTLEQTRNMSEGEAEISLEEVIGILGADEYHEFERCLMISQKILDNPMEMVGHEALIAAAQLAALRTKIGTRAQYYKTADKNMIQRRRKDLLLTMFTALEENINTLKLLGRIEVMNGGR